MKQLVKLYGINDLGIPETYPKEILMNYDKSKDIPSDFILLEEKEVNKLLKENKEIVENIFKKQREEIEKAEKESFKNKNNQIINLIDLIRSFSEEEILIIKNKLLGEIEVIIK